MSGHRLPLSYVLPIRARDARGADELSSYLRWLAGQVQDVVVVDGSDGDVYATHARRFGDAVRHLRPHRDLHFVSGKVNGVITGVREATCEAVLLADDDVRYDVHSLRGMAHLLGDADIVCPQNYFSPLPWHAILDSARSLIARAFSHDMPGTLGVRRSRFLGMGAYDGDVLFENLELIRTVRASGGRVVSRRDLYVRRLPPTATHFLSQRVRQAYDEFARPVRMAAALAVIPALALSRRPRRTATGLALASVAWAEAGRRRSGGARVFPRAASAVAPGWVAERAICAWLALGCRLLRGGVPYGGVIMRRAATPTRRLRGASRSTALPP